MPGRLTPAGVIDHKDEMLADMQSKLPIGVRAMNSIGVPSAVPSTLWGAADTIKDPLKLLRPRMKRFARGMSMALGPLGSPIQNTLGSAIRSSPDVLSEMVKPEQDGTPNVDVLTAAGPLIRKSIKSSDAAAPALKGALEDFAEQVGSGKLLNPWHPERMAEAKARQEAKKLAMNVGPHEVVHDQSIDFVKSLSEKEPGELLEIARSALSDLESGRAGHLTPEAFRAQDLSHYLRKHLNLSDGDRALIGLPPLSEFDRGELDVIRKGIRRKILDGFQK
jgi:hypothetical protein